MALEKIKNNYGIIISKRSMSDWRKRAKQELYGTSSSVMNDILEERNKARNFLLNKDSVTYLINERFSLLELQKKRIETNVKIEIPQNKLIPTTVKEIEICNEIINSLVVDLRSLGLMRAEDVEPKVTEIEAMVALLRRKITYEQVEGKENNKETKTQTDQ